MGALMEFHFEALREYREENTALFYLVLSTVDMTGTRHETDIAYIERHFHNGAQRDGQSFLKWLHVMNARGRNGRGLAPLTNPSQPRSPTRHGLW